MGIFFNNNSEERGYTPSFNNDVFSAFPAHTLPISNLGWDEQRALKNSDIFTAVFTIAKDISKLDIKVKEDGIVKEKSRLENLINNRPNEFYSGHTLKMIITLSSLLTKHGYIYIERMNGQPVELYHIQTSRVQLKNDDDGGYYYEVNNGNAETLEVAYGDIIDVKFHTVDGVSGVGILDALRDDLDAQTYSKKFFANAFKNGIQAGSVLRMKDGKLSPEARKRIKDEFQKANSGEDNVNKVIVLDETMSFEQLEINADILQLITNNKSSSKEIAKIFGLPPSKLGIESPNTSMQDQMDDYLYNTLSSYMKVWTSQLGFTLLNSKDDYKKEFVFDDTSLRQVNYTKYVETLNLQLQNGAITLDEYREAIGLPPLPNGLGTKHRVDLNHIDLELADDFQLRDTSTNNQVTKAVSDDASDKGGVIDDE